MVGAFVEEALDRLDTEICSAEATLAAARLRMGDSCGETASWYDNAAFDQAHGDVMGAIAHLSHLKSIRVGAYVAVMTGSGTVEVGSLVTIRFDDGTTETLMVSGEHAVSGARCFSNGFDHISTRSPLGAALMGRTAGETVAYMAPSGEIIVTIEAIA